MYGDKIFTKLRLPIKFKAFGSTFKYLILHYKPIVAYMSIDKNGKTNIYVIKTH